MPGACPQVVPCDAAVVQRRGDEYRIPFEQYEQLVGLVVYVQLVDLFERLRRGIIENGRLPHRPDEERVVARFTRGITIDNFHVQVILAGLFGYESCQLTRIRSTTNWRNWGESIEK